MSEAATIAEQQRQLSALAELSLAMAEKVQAATLASDDGAEICRLSDAFCRVSRCVRMCIALSMRLTRGERFAPARKARDLELDLERDDFEDLDDFDEPLERENLYDRLPSGPLPVQIATIARAVASVAKVLPAPLAAEYRARCEAIVANVARPPGERRELVDAAIPTAIERTPTRSRGPPGLS